MSEPVDHTWPEIHSRSIHLTITPPGGPIDSVSGLFRAWSSTPGRAGVTGLLHFYFLLDMAGIPWRKDV